MKEQINILAKLAADYRNQSAQGTHGNYFRRLPMNGPAEPIARPPAPAAPAKKPGMSLEEMGTLRTRMPPRPANPYPKMPPMPARQPAPQMPARQPAPQMPDMRPVGNALRSAGSGFQSLMQKIQAYQQQQAKPRVPPQRPVNIVDDLWDHGS